MDPQVLKFKTFEDKQKAIEELGDVEDTPPGVVMSEEYIAEWDEKYAALESAEVDPEFNPDDTPADPPAGDTPPADPPPGSPPPENVIEQATAPLRSEIERMQSRHNSELENYKKIQQEMMEKIDKLTPQAPAEKPDDTPESSKYDTEMNDLTKEIENIERDLNDIPEDEYEKRMKVMTEHSKKNSRLTTLLRKAQFEALKQNNKEMADIKAADQKRQDEAKRKQAIQEDNRRREETRLNRIKEAEAFRTQVKEFGGKKTYEEMESDYDSFVDKLGERYFQRSASQLLPEEREIALAAYQDKSPVLMSKISDLKEPEDMQKYILLTEVESARLGLTLDKHTGKWYQKKDGAGNKVVLPDLETAYDYVKKIKGITANQIAEMQKNTALQVKKAIEQRTNPGEIDEPHRSPDADDGMTEEVARKVLEEYDEERTELLARQAVSSNKPLPREVVYVNRALALLKLDPITGATE